jgi:hypothetical protein
MKSAAASPLKSTADDTEIPPSAKKAKRKEKKTRRERFIEIARAIGVDESGKEFERLFGDIGMWGGYRMKS